MIISDNFLEQSEFEHLRDEMLSPRFPWAYSPSKSRMDINDPAEHFANQQMYHNFYGNHNRFHEEHSMSMQLVWPLLKKLMPLALLRIKANLQFHTAEIYQAPFHTDMPPQYDFTTCVYYLNTNNGSTVFKDTREFVESVENRMVIFDGKRSHAGTTCTNNKIRLVLNLNFIQSNEVNLQDYAN